MKEHYMMGEAIVYKSFKADRADILKRQTYMSMYYILGS